MKDWNVLINRTIIDLMIGDSLIKDDLLFQYKMPYMRGQDICELAKKIGKPDFSSDKLSHWVYMSELLEYVIENKKISIFFRELLELKRFRHFNYQREDYRDSGMIYWEIVHGLFRKINEELFFDKCHIEYDMQAYEFSLIDDDNEIVLNTEKIINVDKIYIKDLTEQINKVIKSGDYESAITKSRTLIEEVMAYGIEKKNKEPSDKGNINNLYSQFKDLYNMHTDPNMDKRINMLLSGFEKIITSIAQMRDKNSDAHGAGNKRINIEEHHAVLYANSAITISNFLLAVIENNKG